MRIKYSISKFFPTHVCALIILLASSLAAPNPSAAPLTPVFLPQYHESLLEVMNLTYSHRYDKALKNLTKALNEKVDLTHFFSGIIFLAKFNDLGDTTALSQAKQLFKNLTEKKTIQSYGGFPPQLITGLSYMQLSYIETIYHNPITAFWLTKKGLKLLKKHPQFIETQCTVHIYNYYKQAFAKYLKWLPFVKTDRSIHRRFLKQHFHQSHYFWTFFITPLIWFHFDIGDYNTGLSLSRYFLKRAPNHRQFNTIQADFLYKLKKYDAALEAFKKVIVDYENYYKAHPSPKYIKIYYYSAIGNLVRVYHDMGDEPNKQKYRKLWLSKECQQWYKWLPKSLKNDLKRFQ